MSSIFLSEILNNTSSLLISLCGMSMVYYLLYRTSGFRFSPGWSVLLMAVLWTARYFGYSVYLSKYLSRKYAGEQWFLTVSAMVSLSIIFLGIVLIALIYKGNLLKNLLMTGLTEIFVSMIFMIPAVFVASESQLERNFLINGWSPTETVMVIFLFILCIVGIHKMEPWLEKYRNWEPEHPVVLIIFLVIYFSLGMYSNIRYALEGGKTQFLLFLPLVVIILAFLTYGYCYGEWLKVVKRRKELRHYEDAMMKHYQQVMIQSVRVDRYNKEIRQAIEDLTEKMIAAESGKNPCPPEGQEGESSSIYASRMKNLAREYLSRLEEEYASLSLSRHTEDIRMNEFLNEYEEKFAAFNVPVRFSFTPDRKPEGIVQEEVEDLLRLIFDDALVRYSYGTVNDESVISLRGGRTGSILVLSCSYDGSRPTGQAKRNIVRQVRKMKGDIEIEEKDGLTKIIMAFPSVYYS